MASSKKPPKNSSDKNDLMAHRHDRLTRRSLTDVKVARDLVINNVSPALLEHINLESLKVSSKSFVGKELQETRTDLTIECMVDDGPAFLYFLIEHQSKEDEMMIPRLMSYNAQLIEEYLRNNRGQKVPPIFNKVIYNGRKPYQGAKSLLGAFSSEQLAMASMKEEFVIDLSQKPDEAIIQEGHAALLQLALKIRDAKTLWSKLNKNYLDLQLLIAKESYGANVIMYIMKRQDISPQEIERVIANFNPKAKEKIMSTYDQFVNKGIEQGLEQGIERGLKQAISRLAHRQGISEAEAAKILQP